MAQVNQATRPMRRLYVGGIPQPCYDFMLTTFLNQVRGGVGVEACRGGCGGLGVAVEACSLANTPFGRQRC